jgi:hypothetical protein
MNKTFELKEWNNYLLHFKDEPIKILEIGIDNGNVLQQFIDVFLDSNENSKYYGIDTWDESKENEKIVNDIINKSSRKDNIHLIKKQSITVLPEFIVNKMSFDVIYINSLYIDKNIFYASNLAIKLLNMNGVMIFNDYITKTIESNVFNPNSVINSILDIFKDEIEILYIGYHVILKKVNIKNNYLHINNIVNEFINILNKFWINNQMNEYGILLNISKLPTIKPKYEDSLNIKLRELKGIEIFNNLKIDHLMYKYIPLTKINDEINYFRKYNKITHNINKIYRISTYNKYALFNFISINKSTYLKNSNSTKILIDSDINNTNLKKTYELIHSDRYTGQLDINFINILEAINDKNNIKTLFDKVKKDNIKTDNLSGAHLIKYGDFSKMYNNILLQVILSKYTLKLEGSYSIIIDTRYDFVNDLLLLLNHLFNKVKINIGANKIGRFYISIIASGFLGITDELFNKIYDIITTTDKEIISLFDNQEIYIDSDSIQNNVFDQTKKIINYINKHSDIIEQNIEKINISMTKRTIDDIITYLL